jgi:hypothetical protein
MAAGYHNRLAETLDTISAATAAPTTGDRGTNLGRNPRFVHIIADVSGGAGTATFRVWHYFAAADLWALDLSLGPLGVVSVVDTDPVRLLSVEAPGDSVYINRTDVVGNDLDISIIQVTEE